MKKLIVIFAMVLMSQMSKGQVSFSDTLWTEDRMSPGTFIAHFMLDTTKQYKLGTYGICSIIVNEGADRKLIFLDLFHFVETTDEGYRLDKKNDYNFYMDKTQLEKTVSFLNKNYEKRGGDVWIQKVGSAIYAIKIIKTENYLFVSLAQEK
jgi:hypothetical protein